MDDKYSHNNIQQRLIVNGGSFSMHSEPFSADYIQQLQKNNELLTLLLQSTGAVVWKMDANKNRQLLWDEFYQSLFGKAPVSISDSWGWWLQRVHPDERQQVEESLLEAVESDSTCWTLSYQMAIANGDYHLISDIAYISRDDKGRVLNIIGAQTDIHQHQKLELAFREKERQLSALMKCGPDALVVMDDHGVITDNNAIAEQLFGYSNNEFTGQSIGQFMPSQYWEHYKQSFRSYYMTDNLPAKIQRWEVLGLRKDKSTFPIEISVSKVEQCGLLVGQIRDLSEYRLLEQEITNISTWEQERTGRELHDGLGQRLTGLMMLTASLQKAFKQQGLPEAEQLQDIIGHLKGAANEVTRLSHGLAAVSISPDGLIDALSLLVEQVGDTHGVKCRLNAPSSIVINDSVVAAELYRLAQEAFNNALKYAQAKHITIMLAEKGGAIELSVIDDGCGFDMQNLMSYDGFGIRIMGHRAKSIGATLEIDTDPGKGTTVRCNYPYQVFPGGSDKPH